MTEGSLVVTRGNEQAKVLSQLLKIGNHGDRVIVLPYRMNNIFALIAKTMWVLGGRKDLTYLSHYFPRDIDFSDDGKTWRGAYGSRLRNWDGFNQFKQIAKIIKDNPNIKRVYFVSAEILWRPAGYYQQFLW